MIDLRRIRIGIEIRGQLHLYEGLRVSVTGTKYANPLQNECTIVMDGLNKETRDFLLTETSQFNNNRTPKRITVEVGRVSTGLFMLYTGDIISAQISSPPDVTLTISAKTNNANGGNIVTYSGRPLMQLSEIAEVVAANNSLRLDFQASDKNIANYTFNGAAAAQVADLQRAGNVRAFVDDGSLIVKDYNQVVRGRRRVVSMASGMVGIPKPTEQGVEVTYLIDGESSLGGQLTLNSKMNKSLNGDYVINQLKFEVSSHSDPFFYTALCSRL